jgi:hypothetical protein
VSCWFHLNGDGEIANSHVYGPCIAIAGDIGEMYQIGEEDQGNNSFAFRETMPNIVRTIFLIFQAIEIPGFSTTHPLCAFYCMDNACCC